jgi:enoyl-CoA hydratase/carnithine racemase
MMCHAFYATLRAACHGTRRAPGSPVPWTLQTSFAPLQSAIGDTVDTNEHLTVERRAAHLWIRFERAEKANALTVGMMDGARDLLANAAADEHVRAVLFTGAGDRVFSAGADVREQPGDGDMMAHRARRSAALFELLDSLIDHPKPVVAVLNGVASGGGAMLALLTDARVAVDTAGLALPEIDLGLPTFAGASIACEVAGLAVAFDLVQSGRRMPADEALSRGLVSGITARGDLHAAATKLAAQLAAKDARAYAANKAWLNRRVKAALAEAREAAQAHRRTARSDN